MIISKPPLLQPNSILPTTPKIKIQKHQKNTQSTQIIDSQEENDQGLTMRIKFRIKKQVQNQKYDALDKDISRRVRTEGQASGFQNLIKSERYESSESYGNLHLKLSRTDKAGPQHTKSQYFNPKQDVKFVLADPNRVSRYRQSMHQSPKQHKKWDKSLQRYMQARTKISTFFNSSGKSSQFDQMQLDRNNMIIRNKKLLELKCFSQSSPQNRPSVRHPGQYVSFLIPKTQSPSSKIKYNKMLENASTKSPKGGHIRRCDALLVNFVSTYFKRKFYKKSKKVYALNRTKTDQPELRQMVDLGGKVISDDILESFFNQQEGRSQERQQMQT